MDFTHVLAQQYIRSLTDITGSRGITAFSALPDAPVLAERTSRVRALIAVVRSGAVRPTPATRPSSSTAVPAFAADGCR